VQFPSRPSAGGFPPRDDGGSGIWRRGPRGLTPVTLTTTRGAAQSSIGLHALAGAFALALLVGTMLTLGQILVELTERLAELGHGSAMSRVDGD
jgi:hypothetical protein